MTGNGLHIQVSKGQVEQSLTLRLFLILSREKVIQGLLGGRCVFDILQ